jgi:hypothetical protein
MFENQFVAIYSHYYFDLEQLLELLPTTEDDEYPTWADYNYFYWGCWKNSEKYCYVIQISDDAYRGYLAKRSRFPLKMRIGMKMKKFYWAGVGCVKQDVVYHWHGAEYSCGLSLDDLRSNRKHFVDIIIEWLHNRGFTDTRWMVENIPFIERFAIDARIINEVDEYEKEARCC